MATLILDIECYRNYFLVLFLDIKTRKTFYSERYEGQSLDIENIRRLLKKNKIITFNGQRYDIPMIYLALEGATNAALKAASDDIILNQMMWWIVEDRYDFHISKINHIDIINVIAGTSSLKLYGARIHFKKLQELPVPPDSYIEEYERPILRKYCRNDCEVTDTLYQKIQPQIDLRIDLSRQYNIDLRSKSDAQIAEAVIKEEYLRITGTKIQKPIAKKSYKYIAPYFVDFDTEQMNQVLKEIEAADFKIQNNGYVIEPPELKRTVEIAGRKYKMGIGGLHAVHKKESYYTDKTYQVVTIDVASYYPVIILNSDFYPKHIGPTFLDIFKKLVDQRIKAKRDGDKVTADTLKITINGTFGKFGSKYSVLYSPDLMFHTTVTGQLCLLMLIEQLELINLHVISANTDGLELYIKHKDIPLLRGCIAHWELDTGFTMEENNYRSVNYRDVNNYIAVTDEGKVKTKGIFVIGGLAKNPVSNICIKAAIDYVKDGANIEETILDCNDISEFVTIRTVRGGAKKDGEEIGKSIRWYYSTETTTPINYCTNNNKVPKSDGAMPLMDLPEDLPADLDYDHYIDETKELLQVIRA